MHARPGGQETQRSVCANTWNLEVKSIQDTLEAEFGSIRCVSELLCRGGLFLSVSHLQ